MQWASSCLNWWKGPLESDLNGLRPLCLLEWLDLTNDTNNYELYIQHGHFHVVSEARSSPFETSTTSLPVPAVSYHYFLSIVNKCDIQFKDLSLGGEPKAFFIVFAIWEPFMAQSQDRVDGVCDWS